MSIRPMSGWGQTRSSSDVGSMSGLPETGQGWVGAVILRTIDHEAGSSSTASAPILLGLTLHGRCIRRRSRVGQALAPEAIAECIRTAARTRFAVAGRGTQ